MVIYYDGGVVGERLARRPHPVLGMWWMETLDGIWLENPVVADLQGAAVVLGAIAVDPACRIDVDDDQWRGRVLSEDPPDWGLEFGYACWRRFLVANVSSSLVAPTKTPDTIKGLSGLPRDTISLGALSLATGFPLDAQTATELGRLRSVAIQMVWDRAPHAAPAIVVGAVARLVGYLHERPVGSEAAWRGSGAAQLLQDSVGD